jgi:hypothetical protein
MDGAPPREVGVVDLAEGVQLVEVRVPLQRPRWPQRLQPEIRLAQHLYQKACHKHELGSHSWCQLNQRRMEARRLHLMRSQQQEVHKVCLMQLRKRDDRK